VGLSSEQKPGFQSQAACMQREAIQLMLGCGASVLVLGLLHGGSEGQSARCVCHPQSTWHPAPQQTLGCVRGSLMFVSLFVLLVSCTAQTCTHVLLALHSLGCSGAPVATQEALWVAAVDPLVSAAPGAIATRCCGASSRRHPFLCVCPCGSMFQGSHPAQGRATAASIPSCLWVSTGACLAHCHAPPKCCCTRTTPAARVVA
jgi:hypothetical protein